MKVLQFYTSTGARDAERVSSQDALLCPRHKLLPFQLQREHLASTYISSVTAVNCEGVEDDITEYFYSTKKIITGWTNGSGQGGYVTFNSSEASILTAIENGVSEGYAYTNEFALATGQAIKVNYNLTAPGPVTYPKLYLGKSDSTMHSTGIAMTTGDHTVYIRATSNDAGNTRLKIKTEIGDSITFSCTFPSACYNTIEVQEFTNYDFITYKGTPISEKLDYGVYYLKVSDGTNEWFSEWFKVQNIQPTLLADWDGYTYYAATYNEPIDTIYYAENSSGDAYIKSETFSVTNGEKLIFTYDLGMTSGEIPSVSIYTGATLISNTVTLTPGMHETEFIVTSTSSAAYLSISNTDTSYWSMKEIALYRRFGNYVYVKFTNTNDIQGPKNIMYQYGFTQEVYLDAVMNAPTHEIVETGEEKNGVFYPEKLVDKLVHNIIAYVSRTLFNAMRLLPMHDSIEIIDEVGNVYEPSVGNVRVAMDWTTFDTGTLRIDFNEEGDVWTSNMDNIV